MLNASISLGLSGNIFVFVLFVIIFIAASILFYRYTLPPISLWLRIVLTVLRSIVLVLLIFLLFEPVLRKVTKTDQLPTAVILTDNSRSMVVHEIPADREKLVQKLVRKNILGGISSGVKQDYYLFNSDIKKIDGDVEDSLLFIGDQTNIDNALSKLKETIHNQNVQLLILVSDGNYTSGKNPIHEAEALGIPVYTVGVGDTSEQKDILIQKVLTNTVVYAESRVPVDVTVASSGIENQTVEVTISDESRVIGREILRINPQTRSYPVKFYVEPKQEGIDKYTVRVSKVAGEVTERNNYSTLFMKVLRRKLRLLIIGGAPSPDISIVRQILDSDQHYTVESFIQKGIGEFYEGQLRGPEIDSTDCFIFIGFPSRASGMESIRFLNERIDQKKIPVLFINQRQVDYSKLQTFLPLLPFTWRGSPEGEVMVTPVVPVVRKLHPLIVRDGDLGADSWNRLPPIYKSTIDFRLKPEAELLISGKLQGVVTDEPLIAFRDINGQKSLAITGYGIWRWKLLTLGSDYTEKLLSRFLLSTVQWLTTIESREPVRLQTTKEIFTTAEAVEFSGQVYDEIFKPVEDAEFTVEARKGEEKYSLELKSIGNGRYEGSLGDMPEGDYRFTGEASKDGNSLGQTVGRFSVGDINVEFLETRMNKALLEQMAYRTGGSYFPFDQLGDLNAEVEKNVSFTNREISEENETELWNWQYLGGFIILLLAAEWLLRKRNGML